jgi:hypothetical protein
MKTLIFILICAFSLPGRAQFPYKYPHLRPLGDPFETASGFMLGTVLNIEHQGSVFWRYRYEGSFMVGRGTSAGPITDVDCATQVREELSKERNVPRDPLETNRRVGEACLLLTNPWRYSFFDSTFYYLSKEAGNDMVVLFYRRLPWAPQALLTDTTNFLKNMWKVDPSLPIEPNWKAAWYRIPISSTLTRERGFVLGRVVSAMLKDPIRKTYEIIVQQGDLASNFRALSVSDPELFDYIVRTMFTGRIVRVEYVKIFPLSVIASELSGYETEYRVMRVSVGE